MTFRSVDPSTGEELERRDVISDAELDELVRRADSTFFTFRERSFSDRGDLLRSAAEILEKESEELGRLMTREMGKPLGQAISEAEKCAWVCRHYADHGEEYLVDEHVETEADRSFVRREPVGPILAVMPWNFPFWQLFRHAAPALMAGNVVLLKHAPTVPGCARAIEELFERAGFPEGAVQNLYIEKGQVADLLEDPRVRAATLTGSVPAGKAVASEAASRVKQTVLELGGSDPFVVLPSADVEAAVETALRARVQNSGQSCIAAKRMVLHEEIAGEFRQRFVERMESLEVGDPTDPGTDVGPLAAEHVLHDLDRQVRETLDAGAEALCGGEPLDRDGFWYPPTVLDQIPIDSPAYREELFGPAASLFEVPDLDGAIRLANDTDFGLGASAWTGDEDEQERLIRDLEAGVVFVNEMVKSDPRLPFGGVKESGYGRELGRAGIREFVNVKTVWVE